MDRIFLIFLLIASLFIEGTLLPFPLVFIIASVLLIFYPDALSFITVFIVCLFLDIIVLNHFALTLVFVFGFQLLLYILQKPLSLAHPIPKLAVLFIAAIIYQKIVGYPLLLMLDIITFLGLFAWVKMSEPQTFKINTK